MESMVSNMKSAKRIALFLGIGVLIMLFLVYVLTARTASRTDNAEMNYVDKEIHSGFEKDISKWKTYWSAKFNYEIKYPPNLIISEENNGDRLFFYHPDDATRNAVYMIELNYLFNTLAPSAESLAEVEQYKDRNAKFRNSYWVREKFNAGGADGLILEVNHPGWNLYSILPYYDRWLVISYGNSRSELKEILSTLKLNRLDINKKVGVDIQPFIPEQIDDQIYGNIPKTGKTSRVAEVKIGNIDDDDTQEIVFATDSDKISTSIREEIVVLDIDKYSGGSYRPVTGFQDNYFRRIYDDGITHSYVNKAGSDPGLVRSELDLKDIDNDGIQEILYSLKAEKGELSAMKVLKYSGRDRSMGLISYNDIFDQGSVNGSISDIKDLDGDGIFEIRAYKNILSDDISLNKKAFENIQSYDFPYEDFYTKKDNFPEEFNPYVALWPDVYKWDGDKYYLADEKFPDIYKAFIGQSGSILKDSNLPNGKIKERRWSALALQQPSTAEAHAGESITTLARKAVAEYLEQSFGSEYLNAAQKIYAEDYLKLKLKNKYKKIWPGDKVEFRLDLIDEAVLKAKKI